MVLGVLHCCLHIWSSIWEDPLRREGVPTPVFWPGESHGQRILAGYGPWGRKELDMTERLSLSLPLIFNKCLQGRNTFHQFCQILRLSQTCMYTPAPSFLLPLLAEFLSLRAFSIYNVDCGSPFLCLPEGGTTIQVCGFTLVGRLVQLSAAVLGSSHRELPQSGWGVGWHMACWGCTRASWGDLGVSFSPGSWAGFLMEPRMLSAGTMSFNALQVSYTLLSQSAPSSQSWSSQFNSLDAVRARSKSLWQHPAQLGKLGFLTGSPLPTQENSLGVLWLSVLPLGRGDADTFTRWPNCSSFFFSNKMLELLWKPGLPQRLTHPYMTPQLSVLQAFLDHSPEGSQSCVGSTACSKVHLPMTHTSQYLASEGGLEGQM